MTDLVRADPESLEAYTEVTQAADDLVVDDVAAYRTAWLAFTAGPFVPPLSPPLSKDADVASLLAEVVHLDGLPTALAVALRSLDENGDGALSAADGVLVSDHPELLPFLFPQGLGVGDTAVSVLLEHFDRLDTADDGGDPDGLVSRDDVEAVAADPTAPWELQAAARYLLDNPTLYTLVDSGADGGGPWSSDGDIKRADIETFLQTNEHLRDLVAWSGWADHFDTADEGGDGDGHVSDDDLEAVASDDSVPQSVRDAARFLLDTPSARLSLSLGAGDDFNFVDGFRDQVLGRLINGQAYADDPEAAASFVQTLPVASGGGAGLPITLVADDGFEALARAALLGTGTDLTDTQTVISHLPETTSARRNDLITGFYDLLAQRADGVFADATGATAGDPTSAGHPGVNWLIFAPWASSGVHDVITGEFRVMGMIGPTAGGRQGAADGNQWIFDDITSRYAAFVELYEASGGHPSTAQLERFFADNFDDGDLEIRTGFQAYVAALEEPDPARRQQLMFQANTLVATHEQAGADPYLSQVATGPDSVATEFIDVQMGEHLIEVNHDLDPMANRHNLVDDVPILGLDPADLDHADLSGNGIRYGTGDSPSTVDLADISGWGDELDVSTREWFDEKGQGTTYVQTYSRGGPVAVPEAIDPDHSLEGTGADSWPDYEDRMWNLTRLFEQLHTDPSLYATGDLRGGLDLDWLPAEQRAAVAR